MGIINFLKNIGDTLSYFVDVVSNLISSAIKGFDVVYDSVSFPLFIAGNMPTIITTCMCAVIVVAILKFIWHY